MDRQNDRLSERLTFSLEQTEEVYAILSEIDAIKNAFRLTSGHFRVNQGLPATRGKSHEGRRTMEIVNVAFKGNSLSGLLCEFPGISRDRYTFYTSVMRLIPDRDAHAIPLRMNGRGV